MNNRPFQRAQLQQNSPHGIVVSRLKVIGRTTVGCLGTGTAIGLMPTAEDIGLGETWFMDLFLSELTARKLIRDLQATLDKQAKEDAEVD